MTIYYDAIPDAPWLTGPSADLIGAPPMSDPVSLTPVAHHCEICGLLHYAGGSQCPACGAALPGQPAFHELHRAALDALDLLFAGDVRGALERFLPAVGWRYTADAWVAQQRQFRLGTGTPAEPCPQLGDDAAPGPRTHGELTLANARLREALRGVLRSAGYESGEAPWGMLSLNVGRHYLDAARAALAEGAPHT